MIATLMNPVSAILGGILFGLGQDGQTDLGALFLVTWLLTVSTFAMIGAWVAPRRSRALAAAAHAKP